MNNAARSISALSSAESKLDIVNHALRVGAQFGPSVSTDAPRSLVFGRTGHDDDPPARLRAE